MLDASEPLARVECDLLLRVIAQGRWHVGRGIRTAGDAATIDQIDRVVVDARRVEPEEDANHVAAEQVIALLYRLPERDYAPLFVFDAGYDPVRLQQGLEGCCVQILVRLNSGRVFYFDPKPLPKLEGRREVAFHLCCCSRPYLHRA